MALFLLVFTVFTVLPHHARAEEPPAAADDKCEFNGSEGNICTNQPFFDPKNECNKKYTGENGILQSIMREVDDSIKDKAEKLFEAIAGNPDFNAIVAVCFTLFVIFFAVAFMFGFLQLTLSQGIMRLIKIGVIVWIISPDGWDAFNEYIVQFFNGGTRQLIGAMINIANPSVTIDLSNAGAPFVILENSVNLIFSPRMAVTLVACLTTPPYGLLVGAALGYAIFEFIKAVLNTLMVYALSLIAKALLFGIAPIFFVFLLFERTKPLFQGWVNQLVNFSLQPILMFAFLAFFSTMIESSANQILQPAGTNVCFVKTDTQGGTPFDLQNWRFVCPDGTKIEPFSGSWGTKGPVGCPGADAFPVSIVNILIFLLIVHLASMMITIITVLAGELSQGMTRLDQISGQDGIGSWMSGGRGGGGSDYADRAAAMQRPTPSPRSGGGGG